MTPFKRLVTGKSQPGGPGRSSEVRGGSSRKLEEVAKMEGGTPTKQRRKMTKTAAATKPAALAKPASGGRGKGGRQKKK